MSFTVSKNGRLALLNVATQVSVSWIIWVVFFFYMYVCVFMTFLICGSRAFISGTCRTVCW